MSQLSIFFVLTLLAVGFAPDPSGTYCGSYLEVIDVTVKVLNLTDVDLKGSVFGLTLECPDESVLYSETTHAVSFPKIQSTDDCLGKTIRSYGQDPSQLVVIYNPNNNTLTVTGGTGITFYLTTTCSFSSKYTKQGKGFPTGAYCANYKDQARVRATIVTVNKTIAIAGISSGKIFSCPKVPFELFANNTIFFPGAYRREECLGSILAANNIDPSSFSVVYNPHTDAVVISGPNDVAVELDSCSIGFEKEEEARVGADPSGSYCGGYEDIATVKVTVKTLTDVDIYATAFGDSVSCLDEVVSYSVSNQSIVFPNIVNASDCLAKALTGFGVTTDLTAQYDPATDSVTVKVEGVAVELTKSCTFYKHSSQKLRQDKLVSQQQRRG